MRTSQTRRKQSTMIRLVSGRAKPNRMLRAASQARTERLLLDAESAAQLRHKLALMNIAAQHIAEHRSHFNPNQPRVPAGNPDGGQWTSSGGGIGARLAAADKPRFGGGAALAIILEIAKQVIERYRSENGLWDLFGYRHGTVAFTTIDGTDIFGSNSGSPTYTSADRAAAISMRTIVVKKYPEVFSAERVGRMPNDALFHAETTVLLIAARQNGVLWRNERSQYMSMRVCATIAGPRCPMWDWNWAIPPSRLLTPPGQRTRCATALG